MNTLHATPAGFLEYTSHAQAMAGWLAGDSFFAEDFRFSISDSDTLAVNFNYDDICIVFNKLGSAIFINLDFPSDPKVRVTMDDLYNFKADL